MDMTVLIVLVVAVLVLIAALGMSHIERVALFYAERGQRLDEIQNEHRGEENIYMSVKSRTDDLTKIKEEALNSVASYRMELAKIKQKEESRVDPRNNFAVELGDLRPGSQGAICMVIGDQETPPFRNPGSKDYERGFRYVTVIAWGQDFKAAEYLINHRFPKVSNYRRSAVEPWPPEPKRTPVQDGATGATASMAVDPASSVG